MGPIAERSQSLDPGDLIASRYRIVQLLGRGGMGEVYEAHDQLLDESIAIKTLRADLIHDSGILRRFQKEIHLARKVTHANVCRVFEVGVHEFPSAARAPVHFFTMELLKGETLSARIRRQGRLSSDEAFPLIAQIADGLEAAHKAGIIHRDFKSANIILTGDRAVITDFGLARLQFAAPPSQNASTLTTRSQLAGTVAYMSPEQLIGGTITPASDVYSFGIVLFEMATGRLPFEDRHIIQSAVQRATGEVPDVRSLTPDIDPRWESVITGCLQREPERRCSSMAQIAELFRNDHSGTALRSSGKSVSFAFRIGLTVAACLVAIVALFWYLSGSPNRDIAPGSTIVVVPTVNASGESGFGGLAVALQAGLDQSSRLRLWDTGQLSSMVRSMRHDPAAELTPKDWREIAFRTQAHLLVFSTLSRLGSGYALSVHCEQIGTVPDPPVQQWDRTINANGPDGLFEAVHAATSWIRTIAGESAIELSARNRLPQDITSSSWEALELFEDARRLSQDGKAPKAIPILRRAIQLDPQFAMAAMRLGDILISQRDGEEGYRFWRQAIELGRSQRLSERERLIIESRYPLEVGDYAKAEPILREWVTKFPNDPRAREWLVACLLGLGRYPEVVSIGRQSRELFGPSLFGTARIIEGLAMSHQLADIEAELGILKQLSAPTWELRFRGALAAMREDYVSAEALFRQLASKAEGEEASRATSLLVALALERGELDLSASLLSDGVAHDRQAGEDGLASQKASGLAFVESIRGNRERSRAWALESVALRTSPQTVMQSVSVLARQGFLNDAKRLADRMPAGEGPRYESGLLRMQGEILAAQGQYARAIDTLERAARKDSAIRPKEYLARVLALAGQPERARILYSEIVNTPWLIWGSPESEWPGLRLLAKRYLQSRKGE